MGASQTCATLIGKMPPIKWQELGDSNPRPSVLETDALPTELNSCSPDLAIGNSAFSGDTEKGQGIFPSPLGEGQ